MNFICNLTREAILVPCLKTITAKETAKLFFKHVFPRTGLPQVIHSDLGPQFIAQFWRDLWKKLQTKVALSAPHHPKSNPYIKRQNKTFQEALLERSTAGPGTFHCWAGAVEHSRPGRTNVCH